MKRNLINKWNLTFISVVVIMILLIFRVFLLMSFGFSVVSYAGSVASYQVKQCREENPNMSYNTHDWDVFYTQVKKDLHPGKFRVICNVFVWKDECLAKDKKLFLKAKKIYDQREAKKNMEIKIRREELLPIISKWKEDEN